MTAVTPINRTNVTGKAAACRVRGPRNQSTTRARYMTRDTPCRRRLSMERPAKRSPSASGIIARPIESHSPGDGSDAASIGREHDRAERGDHGPVPRDYEPEKRWSVGLPKEGLRLHRDRGSSQYGG